MNIAWVVSTSTQLNPTIDINRLKVLGSLWGGWQTWRTCQTDNVICHELKHAKQMVDREFFKVCNLYLPNSVYISLDKPIGVKLYDGECVHELDNYEDVVAMHLASSASDIVLLLGFDFSEHDKIENKLSEHKAHNYRSLTKQAIKNTPNVQWVAIDHEKEFRKDLSELSNLGKDTLENILKSIP